MRATIIYDHLVVVVFDLADYFVSHSMHWSAQLVEFSVFLACKERHTDGLESIASALQGLHLIR